MKAQRQQISSELDAFRDALRLRSFGCDDGSHIQAVMLYAVAKAIGRPVEAMPCPDGDQLWASFKAAIDCKAIRLSELPLPLLSYGERFSLAVGVSFNADLLPTGDTFLEIANSAANVGTGISGICALSAILALPTVQATLPETLLRYFGIQPINNRHEKEVYAQALGISAATT